MLRLQDIPPEQMPEVVRVASELYEKDREHEAEAEQRQATVAAAAEVGLPEEYLQRAATELHSRRVEQRQHKRRRNGLLAIGGTILVLGTGGYIVANQTYTPDTAPHSVVIHTAVTPPFAPTTWKLNANTGTQAIVQWVNGGAVIHVDHFAADANGQFFANLNTFDSPKDLTGLRTVSFLAQGTLPNVRIYLENGNERWRSSAVPLQGQSRLVKLDIDQFEYQTRPDRNSKWELTNYKAPGTVADLSFKTGDFVNEVNASGDVVLTDLQIQ